jgi:competence protein ComFC
MFAVLEYFFQGFVSLVYPPYCLICQKSLTNRSLNEVLCPECSSKIRLNIPPFCPKCSRHLGKDPNYARCNSCQIFEQQFDFAWSACLYTDPLKDLIHSYKYHQKTLLRHTFSNLITGFIHRYNFDINQFDLIVPIPLHNTRLRERGYNQSELLAKNLSKKFNISLSINNLIRTRNTQTQTKLGQKERWTNIHQAFKIKNLKLFEGKNILLVDDLLTTGATASEAASALKESGANKVGVVTLAIAP